jgi:diadenosine tetraphosphate (Ap4A) HIT family hydrolase
MGNRATSSSSSSSSPGSLVRKAVRYSAATGEVQSCVFCNIVRGDDPQSTALIAETRAVAAFLPRRQDGARDHILVVPKHHVRNLSSLKVGDPAHLRMLRDMKRHGMTCARARHPDVVDDAAYRLVFHVPPFNSVDHLHLHVFLPPFDNFWKDFTYTGGWPWCESFEHVWQRMGGDDSGVLEEAVETQERAGQKGEEESKSRL